jgi:hypothetical protein
MVLPDPTGNVRFAPAVFAHSYDDGLLDCLKALRLGTSRVVSGDNRAGGIGAAGGRGDLESLASVFISDGDFRGRYDRAARIENRALNAAGGNRALAHCRARGEGVHDHGNCQQKYEGVDLRRVPTNHRLEPPSPGPKDGTSNERSSANELPKFVSPAR